LNRKILVLIFTFLVLVGLYFAIPSTNAVRNTIIWAFFIALAGLYYSYWFKNIVLISSSVACITVLSSVKEYPFYILSVCLVFTAIIPLPYYFHLKSRKLKKELFAKSTHLKIKREKILLKYKESFDERQKYETNVRRINQLYVVGKELFKCVSKEEYAQIILNSIEKKSGVIGCSVFEKTKFDWKILISSGVLQNKNLISCMDSLKFSKYAKKCTVINNKEFENCAFKIIYWPLKIEDELLGCVLIAVRIEYVAICIEEGAILGSQISLGLKRINFFSEISEKSRIDGLTGLYLRRYFLQRLNLEMEREKRYSDGFYILMLDLDYFKSVNDKYGHLTGDKVLMNIAKTVSSAVRPSDLIGRYGGEEFIILMPMINEKEIKSVANKIKDFVQSVVFQEKGDKFNVTISIGISCNSKNIADPNFIINTADKALYEAKNRGRNQVVLYDEIVNKCRSNLFFL